MTSNAAVRVLAAVARSDRGMLADLLPAALPWTRLLPADDRELMTEEFVATAEAAISAGTLALLAQVITEWKHTAQIHADPDLHHVLTRTDLADHGPVPAHSGHGAYDRPERRAGNVSQRSVSGP